MNGLRVTEQTLSPDELIHLQIEVFAPEIAKYFGINVKNNVVAGIIYSAFSAAQSLDEQQRIREDISNAVYSAFTN